MFTGDGAGNMGGPLGDGEGGFWVRGDGEGGFWVRGDGAAMGIIGLGPAAFSGGLLIIMGGEGGKGVKWLADHTMDFGGGGGVGAGAGG